MTTKPGLKFSVAAIDNAKEILRAMPPAPRETKEVSLREAIEELAPTIRGLIGKGYSRQQIVDLVQEQGVGCSLSSLKDVFPPRPEQIKSEVSGSNDRGIHGRSREAAPAAARLVSALAPPGPEVGGQ